MINGWSVVLLAAAFCMDGRMDLNGFAKDRHARKIKMESLKYARIFLMSDVDKGHKVWTE